MLTVTVIGGPTAVLEYGGLRMITDPTFDPPGDYPTPYFTLTKTAGPALSRADVGRLDVVLLTHDQHPDNFDHQGREVVATAPLTLSTEEAAARVAVTALPTWRHHDVGRVRVTAVPALHGPPGCEEYTGTVTGFVLTGPELPTVYVSGDNASLDCVRETAERFPEVDVALLFGGAVVTPLVDAKLTLDAVDMVEAAGILGARHVVPLHVEGWTHFSENEEDVRAAFGKAGRSGLLPGSLAGEAFTLV